MEQGGPGRCWPGRGESGTVGAGRGRAEGGLGSGATGEAPAWAEWVRHGRGGPDQARPGRRQPGGAGRARPRRFGAGPGSGVARVRLGSGATGAGPGAAVAQGAVGGGGDARCSAWKRCERERSERKKGRDRIYSLMFVRLTHQPMNISGLAYVVAVVPYVYQSLEEHRLMLCSIVKRLD
jgi:hypothetical protein